MLKSVAKSLIASLLATAAFSMAYSINDVWINIFINIVIFVICVVVFEKESKEKRERQNSAIDNNMKIMEKIASLNNEICITNSNMLQVNNSIKDLENTTKNKLNEILVQISNNVALNNKKYEEYTASISKLISNSIENTTKHSENIEYILNKGIDYNNKNINKYGSLVLEKMDNKLQSINEKFEEVIDDNIDKVIEELETTRDEVQIIIKEIKRTKSDLVDSINENTTNNIEVIKQYKEIQGAMIKELNVLADKNNHTTELLMSNYKVLNALIEA